MLRRGVNAASPAARRNATRLCRWRCSSRACHPRPRWIPLLDIDALRIAADGVNALRASDRAIVVITHYQRLLNYIAADFVHVMFRGKVVKKRGKTWRWSWKPPA